MKKRFGMKMTLAEQLEAFKQANPCHKFRIHICQESKTDPYTIQVKQKDEGWFCLHGFYSSNGHFRLGKGF